MKELLGSIVGAVLLTLTICLIASYPVMLLWNGCLVGAVSVVNEITWLQALGLVFLFGMLFKTTVTTKK